MIIVVGYLFLPRLNIQREDAKRLHCVHNLKMIGLALKMYTHANNGFLPKDLYSLVTEGYLKEPKNFVCSGVKHIKIPKSFSSHESFITDFYYNYTLGAKMEENNEKAKKQIIALDYAGNHDNYGNILYGDGHVKGSSGYEWYRKAGFDKVPEKTQ